MWTISAVRGSLAGNQADAPGIRSAGVQPAGRLDLRPIIVALLILFLFSATYGASRKDISVGFDEVAHASYVAELQLSDDAVELGQLRMLDPASFRFTVEANYLNHPPYYYKILAMVGPCLEGQPQNIIWHRVINIAVVAAGLLLLISLTLSVASSSTERLILLIPAFYAPLLVPLAGSVNNDNLGFTAGALTLFGCGRFLLHHRHRDLAIALLGVIIAGATKLTAVMLCGGFLSLCLLLDWRSLRLAHVAATALALLIAAAPAVELWGTYGSPAPNTAAQHALLVDGSAETGWARAPRLAPLSYAAHFLAEFISAWKPLLVWRGPVEKAMLAVPLATLLFAAAGIGLALRRISQRPQPDAPTILTVAGTGALAATLAVHMAFSYQRHVETGWLMDAYPRYYLPLFFVIPLATLLLVRRMKYGWRRTSLGGFLIVSPVVFWVFG
jgi:hypothetical protein